MEMKDSDMKYWVIEFLDGDESKWMDVLNHALPLATHIEFNILYTDGSLDKFIEEYESSIVSITKGKEKVYSSGKVLRMKKTDHAVGLLIDKGFSGFRNWFLEDPSLYIEDCEILATISHENQVYLNPEYIDLNKFPHFKLEHRLVEKEEIGFWKYIKHFLNL